MPQEIHDIYDSILILDFGSQVGTLGRQIGIAAS